MNTSRAIEILSALAQGVDPYTGEIYPDESPYNNIETIRALFIAVDGLRKESVKDKSEKKQTEIIELTEEQKELYDNLKKWRLERAKEDLVETFMILSNDTLSRVANSIPTNIEELSKIKGFGEVKLQKYGQKVIEIVQAFHGGHVV